jgi:hypothetical protein
LVTLGCAGVFAAAGVAGCESNRTQGIGGGGGSASSSSAIASSVVSAQPSAAPVIAAPVERKPACPPDMVYVWFDAAAGVCVDRYEAVLLSDTSGERLSPYYPPAAKGVRTALLIWKTRRLQVGGVKARGVPLPSVADWQRHGDYQPRAVVRRGATPNGYVTGKLAQVACQLADKRTCKRREWRRACGGQQGWAFPYGPAYEQGACNVFREAHPAAVLHDDASRGHSDPRLNRVSVRGRPLLRKAGGSARCVSRWGDDAIYDMVGNVDEWLDEPSGTFAGGFYARGTKEGCDWFGGAHSIHYGDYSTGVRCCKDPAAAGSSVAP